jgi:nitrate reductase NapA
MEARMPDTLDRRTFLKRVGVVSAATAAAAATQGLTLAAHAADLGAVQPGTTWKRAPCRLCGVGCGLLIGIAGGRAVAVKGDPDSPVNRAWHA